MEGERSSRGGEQSGGSNGQETSWMIGDMVENDSGRQMKEVGAVMGLNHRMNRPRGRQQGDDLRGLEERKPEVGVGGNIITSGGRGIVTGGGGDITQPQVEMENRALLLEKMKKIAQNGEGLTGKPINEDDSKGSEGSVVPESMEMGDKLMTKDNIMGAQNRTEGRKSVCREEGWHEVTRRRKQSNQSERRMRYNGEENRWKKAEESTFSIFVDNQ